MSPSPPLTDQKPLKLPEITPISPLAPFGWLHRAWVDMGKALLPCLTYGTVLAAISASLSYALVFSGYSDWIMVLLGGFLIIAPMLAMGLYEAARQLEMGLQPQMRDMLFVKGAFRQDLAYLGLALLLIYFFWGRMAQLIYALSTYRKHDNVLLFLEFMVTTSQGHIMAFAGTIVGGVIAFIAYTLVVISAPMLLDQRTNVFIAIITSFRAVTRNFIPMLIWAALIASLTIVGIITCFLGLIVTFPLIGIASWHAYRDLVTPD